MSGKGRGCPLKSQSVVWRLDLNLPEHLEEAGASVPGPDIMVARSTPDKRPSEVNQVDLQTKRVASSVARIDAAPTDGNTAVTAASEHDLVLSSPSPPATERRSEMRENVSLHLMHVGLCYRWHRCAVVNVFLDEVLGSGPPASERLETRRLQKMLQAGYELPHQRLKAYPGGSVVWLASPDLAGEACFVFKTWDVIYYYQAAYPLSSSVSGITDFAFAWTVILQVGAHLLSG